MTGALPLATSAQSEITRRCSSCSSAGVSPVVPHGTNPCVPCPICQATSSWKAVSSTLPSRKGVISATSDPLNMTASRFDPAARSTIVFARLRFNNTVQRVRNPVFALRPRQKSVNSALPPTEQERRGLAAVFRPLSMAAVSLAALALVPVQAQDISDADRSAGVSAITAARAGDWPQAYAAAGRSGNPLPLKIVRWLDYTRTNSAGRFGDISAFIEQNPDWPGQKKLRRQAEAARVGEGHETAGAWLKKFPPISAVGKVRAAAIMMSHGEREAGLAALRAAWVEGDFAPADEHDFWVRFGANVRSEDNIQRLDRLLWDSQHEAARRMLPLVSQDYRTVAEARLALAAGASNIEVMLARVPPALRNNPGLVFDEVHWQRRNEANDAAAQLLLTHPDDPVRPLAWAAE